MSGKKAYCHVLSLSGVPIHCRPDVESHEPGSASQTTAVSDCVCEGFAGSQERLSAVFWDLCIVR
eukprot:12937010-Alexandrium_andersonii.AAC.1